MKEKTDQLVDKLLSAYTSHHSSVIFTVAISGIDASGKGYIAGLMQKELESRGYRVASINIDPWQKPIPIRLQENNAAENFYKNVFRWDDFFFKLIHPLQMNGSLRLDTMLIRTDADEYYPFSYRYEDIDIILVEGIFLLQKKYLGYYDWTIWVDCSFETGLKRAIERNIEKLDEYRLIHDYKTYYYPAQYYHFEKDNPRALADVIFDND